MKAGWTSKRLEEVAEIRLGRTPPRAEKKFWDPIKATDNTWVSIADLSANEGGIITESKEHLSKAGADSTPLVKAGTLLVSFKLSLGKVAIAGKDLRTNEAIAAMQIKVSGLDVNWLKYFFQFFDWDKAAVGEEKVKGKALNKEKLKEIEIPLPPLAEQKRIVALLDEAFAGIDEAKAKAESNDQAAADFLESRLSELFLKPKESPSMISDHCTEVTVGYVGPMADKYVPKGIPFLRSQNVRPFEINFENLMQITPAFEKSLSKSRLAPGDVVVVRTGYPGTAAVIPAELPMANCADLVILRPMKSLDPNYLVAFFNSKVGKDMVLGRLVGAAQKHFNVGAAKSVLLPIPSIQRQREVVSHIAEIRTHVGKLMDNSKGKLSELRELKTSILAQAFAGELTA
ncbi:MAG: hypothetical protein RI910_2001 [Verrucomicrobiota bacterium]